MRLFMRRGASMLFLLLAACAGPADIADGPTPQPTVLPTPTDAPEPQAPASPTDTEPTLPPTPATASPSPGCVNGWLSPPPDSPEYEEGLEILSGYMGTEESLDVAEMRYFTGPDAPWIIEPHYEVVERWYVKAALADDPDFRGRWLLEKRTDRILGVSAVAPYQSEGYASPEWFAFVGDGPPTAYPSLPGMWSGIAYDFVTGEGDHGQPGLPDEVVDCLAGT
jgi:hypothetical protein